MNEIAFLLGLILILVGFVGIIIPFIPGIPIMWLGALAYGAMTGFRELTWPWMLIITLIALASITLDFILSAIMARKFGGSRLASLGSLLGGILGTLYLGAFGALLGAFGGAALTDLPVNRSIRKALRSGAGAVVGFVLALMVDLTSGIAILAIYLLTAIS